MTRRSRLCLSVSRLAMPAMLPAALLAFSPAALAQSGGDSGAEQVVVTARHRSEKAQTVPIAITSVERSRLTNSGITSISQLQKVVPTLQITQLNPRNTSYNIRGLGNNAALANNGVESGVGTYIDGVFYARPAQSSFGLPDLESVQVLRGPQGTLFGKNTTAGAIDVRTLKPSFTPSTEVDASFGNYGYWQLKGTTTRALGDKVAVRISGLIDSKAGEIKNITNGDDLGAARNRAVRGQVLVNVSDELSLRLIADYGRSWGSFPVPLPTGTIDHLTNGEAFPAGFNYRLNLMNTKYGYDYHVPSYNPKDRITDVNSETGYVMETGGASLQGDYSAPFGTFTSITAWRYLNWSPRNDIDATGLDILHNIAQNDRQKQFTQEFRFTSPSGSKLEYTAGVYYFYQDIAGYGNAEFGNDGAAFLLITNNTLNPLANVPANAHASVDGLYALATSDVTTNSAALYGQATYHVTDKLDITAGLRGTYEKKQGGYDQIQYGPAAAAACAANGGNALCPTVVGVVRNTFAPNQFYTANAEDSILSGLANISYKLTDNAFLYASFSRGDKASSISVVQLPINAQGQVTINPVAKPERVDAYEIGAKTSLLDKHLIVNGNLFWSEDSNYQGVATSPLSSTLLTSYITNIPKVRSRGFELDARAIITRGFFLYMNGAYTDAIYESYPNGPCSPEIIGPYAYFDSHGNPAAAGKVATCDLSGAPVAGISRWTMAVGGEFNYPIGEYHAAKLLGYLGADYNLRSSFNTSATNSAYGVVPGYGTLDLRAGVRTSDRKYDVSFWARNALDTYYSLARLPTSPVTGLVVSLPGSPAMYGVTLRARF